MMKLRKLNPTGKKGNTLQYRLVFQYTLIILITVSLLEGLFLITLHHYYYRSIEELLRDRMESAQQLYRHQVYYPTFTERSRMMMNQVSSDPAIEIQFIDGKGNFILSSSGFAVQGLALIDGEDVRQALKGESKLAIFTDSQSGERQMAFAAPLITENHLDGVIRYVTSIDQVDTTYGRLVIWAIAIGGMVVLFVTIFSRLLARSIIRPIEELTHVASQMAEGRYSLRASYPREDEIGNLAHTLNYLAKGIVKSNQLKNEFISSISHELRTPLTSIKGWSETLLLGDLKDERETRTGLEVIVKESNRLTGLVEELLDFSKLQSHHLEIEKEEVNLLDLLHDVYRQFQTRAQQLGITWVVALPSTIPPIIGDENRLKQVLINVVDNAFKFSSRGSQVHWTTNVEEQQIRIEIKDEGCGIPPSELPYVFEKFYKGEAKQAGSGLGLAISAEIIQRHGGTITASSDGLHGTLITILLPLPR